MKKFLISMVMVFLGVLVFGWVKGMLKEYSSNQELKGILDNV